MLTFNERRSKHMNYSPDIQRAIHYIHQHITEHPNIKSVATYIGYSPFHFQRLFRDSVGMSLFAYIRQKRLQQAKALLTHTSLPILEIAFRCDFHTQESFSRAFKAHYHLPPSLYRKHTSHLLQTGAILMTTTINGWFKSGSHPKNYQLAFDKETAHITEHSILLSSIDSLTSDGYGTVMQQFKAHNFTEKRVKFSGFIKSKHVTKSCGLWMRMDSAYYDMLAFDDMPDRAITGTSEWNFYETVLDVPKEADIINIGLYLQGSGKVWLEHTKFQIVPFTVPTTGKRPSDFVPDAPQNLDFSH